MFILKFKDEFFYIKGKINNLNFILSLLL